MIMADRTRSSEKCSLGARAACRSILAVGASLNSVITDIIDTNDTFNTNKIYIMYTINRFGARERKREVRTDGDGHEDG